MSLSALEERSRTEIKSLLKSTVLQSCFGSFRGDKKDMQVHNIYLEQNFNDISVDLNLVAFTAPPLLDMQAQEGGS